VRRVSYFREVPWRWRDVLIGITPLIVVRVIPLPVGPESLPDNQRWLAPALLLLAILDFGWMLFYPLLIARRRQARWPKLPRPRAIGVETLWALLPLPFVFVTISLAFPVMVRLFGGSGVPANPLEGMERSSNPLNWLVGIFVAIVEAPICEEVLFRGLLYNALRQRLPVILAVAIQAIVFGLLHPFDLASSATVALIGVAIGLFYEWRKTLLAPIVLHMLVNAVAIVLTALGIADEANGPMLGVTGDAHQGGCLVKTVAPGSAAEEAGIRPGDIVASVDGKPVTDIVTLRRIILTKGMGDQVSVEFRRGDEVHRALAVLKLRPK